MSGINLKETVKCEQVTMIEMLDARERRVSRQQYILARYNMTLVSFTLNIPGANKIFPLAARTFKEGKKLIKNHLRRHNIDMKYQEDCLAKTGFEFFVAAEGNSGYIKELMVEIENCCELGRIFDIDVIDKNGYKLSREDVGYESRSCILCNDIAHACARSRKHSSKDILLRIIEIMTEYFNLQFADLCSTFACRALMYEVIATPKPGLVDKANNGSHKDMDLYSFIDSSAVLIPFFREFVLMGAEHCGDTPQKLFERIRYMGMRAEDQMLAATNNVNTHKGIIFSMGVLCAALGYMYGNGFAIETEGIFETARQMTQKVMDDFQNITPDNARTYGERLYARYKISGIRGEAANGFASVKKYGIPVLKILINNGFSSNDAGVVVLLNLIANVKDTNIISRADIETQKRVQIMARKLISEGIDSISMSDINEMDVEFMRLNISPGGCADLLAITYFVYFIEKEMYQDTSV